MTPVEYDYFPAYEPDLGLFLHFTRETRLDANYDATSEWVERGKDMVGRERAVEYDYFPAYEPDLGIFLHFTRETRLDANYDPTSEWVERGKDTYGYGSITGLPFDTFKLKCNLKRRRLVGRLRGSLKLPPVLISETGRPEL